MKLALVLAIGAASLIAGSVNECHLCKTSGAAEVFSNLLCEKIPVTAPSCGAFNKTVLNFRQNCSPNSLCLTITKGEEQLRMCTLTKKIGTIRTTKGTVMEVCGRELCNAAGPGAAPALTLSLLLLTTGRLL